MAPVHDAHPRLAVDVRGLADEHVPIAAPFLAEEQVAEVGRARVDRRDDVLGAARGDAGDPLHLLHQRGHVLQAGRGDLVAQREELLLVVGRGGRHARPHGREVRAHAGEELLLFGDDLGRRRAGGAVFGAGIGREHGQEAFLEFSARRAPGEGLLLAHLPDGSNRRSVARLCLPPAAARSPARHPAAQWGLD